MTTDEKTDAVKTNDNVSSAGKVLDANENGDLNAGHTGSRTVIASEVKGNSSPDANMDGNGEKDDGIDKKDDTIVLDSAHGKVPVPDGATAVEATSGAAETNNDVELTASFPQKVRAVSTNNESILLTNICQFELRYKSRYSQFHMSSNSMNFFRFILLLVDGNTVDRRISRYYLLVAAWERFSNSR
jgi:hypothetical protein